MTNSPASTYSHDLRLLSCPRCGAPLPLPVQGGYAQCDYCGAASQFAARQGPAPSRQPRTDEEGRLQRLHQALLGYQMYVPPDVIELLQHGVLTDERWQHALQMWQQARAAVAGGDRSAETDHRLYVLTIALTSGSAGAGGGDAQKRALIETAAELLPSDNHQQALRAMLARSAAKHGDLRGAEQWMATLDPYSEDIEADSAYRYARAYVDSVKQDFQAVVRVLGASTGDVPLTGEVGVVCSVLRANGLERIGDVRGAVEELHMQMSHSDKLALLTGKAIEANASLQPCPQSYPLAKQMLGMA